MWESTVEAVASGVGASIGVAALARRWFRHAVKDVVDESHADIVKRQADFERRQGDHLDAQDRRLERIERSLRGRRAVRLARYEACPGRLVTGTRDRCYAVRALEAEQAGQGVGPEIAVGAAVTGGCRIPRF